MLVLAINTGSSSLKHALVDTDDESVVERGQQRWEPDAEPGRHALALRAALAGAGGRAEAVGHRVVHGGERFTGPVRIDGDSRAAIAALGQLAPLHTRSALEGIDAVSAALPDLSQVASFDTAFHRTLPPAAATYALPRDWTQRFGLRRYGFHGLNVAWCHEQAVAALGACRRLVVCHLGSGCSVTAVLDGRSVDTTMGFTPLDGVPMATRSGSVDPGLLLHLLASGVSHAELEDGLNHRSGLLGISGLAGVSEIQNAAAAGDARAQLAFDVFVHAVSASVGAMTTSLGGLDALVFTGGAGEGSSSLRDAVCARLEHLGARVAILVVPAGEEIVIAREARALLERPRAGGFDIRGGAFHAVA